MTRTHYTLAYANFSLITSISLNGTTHLSFRLYILRQYQSSCPSGVGRCGWCGHGLTILTLMHLNRSAADDAAAAAMAVHVQVMVVHHQRRLHQAAAMVVQRQLMCQWAAQLCHSHIEFVAVLQDRVMDEGLGGGAIWGWLGRLLRCGCDEVIRLFDMIASVFECVV